MDRGIATITSGIVPGFPANMPAHLEQAWLTLVSKPAAATITTTADNGVKIALKKQTITAWALIAFLTGMGVVLSWARGCSTATSTVPATTFPFASAC